MIGAAIIDSLAIEVTLLLLIPLVWKHSKVASALLIPYALWVGFATCLNYTIYILNRA
jgi:tryptophan-rich sensory protein